MASSYQAQNLSYDQQTHAQRYWSSNGENVYPPPNPKSPPAVDGAEPHVSANIRLDPRAGLNRTPSPTPSEERELQSGAIDFKTMRNWRFWIRREWLWYYVIFGVIAILTTLITIYHTQIVHWLTPFTQKLEKLKLGWLIPIGILFVISFPPLFGHEIVAVLCGVVWGLGPGFGIVAAGTFLGEIGNFYAFKYCCYSRGEKMERTKMSYACLAKVVREGGFKIALIARLSVIPGHFTTAIFATCGMNIFTFSLAALLSLPKQFITVYLGVILGEANGQETTKQRLISDGVVGATFLVTLGACWYILRKMNAAKPAVIYDRRKARQAKLNEVGNVYGNSDFSTSDVYNPNSSDSNIPLTGKKNQYGLVPGQAQPYPFGREYQQSSAKNIIYSPKPQQPRYSPDNRYGDSSSPGPASNYTPPEDEVDQTTGSSHQSTPRIPPGGLNYPRTQSPEAISSSPSIPPIQPPPSSSYSQQSSSTSHPYTPYQQTPGQTQFVSYNNPSDQSSTPGYPSHTASPVVTAMHSPAFTPTQYAPQHAYEPSAATYHTAMASSDSLGGFPPSGHGPPPGYR